MSPFLHDSRNIRPDTFELLPENKWFPFQITNAVETLSKKGRNMIKLTCEVLHDPTWAGKWVFHQVVFLDEGERGAAMSVHFRKCIDEPHGGQDEVDAKNWIGKRFMGKVGVREYNGKTFNEITAVSPIRDDAKPLEEPAPPVGAATSASDDDIPF